MREDVKMKKIKTRKLEETSWLAQVLKDKMDDIMENCGIYVPTKWHCLNTLLIIVREADGDNPNVFYDSYNGERCITVKNIPDLSLKYGSDYDVYGMRAKLRGLAERYKDDDGNYLVHVLTTHDLNSARDERGLQSSTCNIT